MSRRCCRRRDEESHKQTTTKHWHCPAPSPPSNFDAVIAFPQIPRRSHSLCEPSRETLGSHTLVGWATNATLQSFVPALFRVLRSLSLADNVLVSCGCFFLYLEQCVTVDDDDRRHSLTLPLALPAPDNDNGVTLPSRAPTLPRAAPRTFNDDGDEGALTNPKPRAFDGDDSGCDREHTNAAALIPALP